MKEGIYTVNVPLLKKAGYSQKQINKIVKVYRQHPAIKKSLFTEIKNAFKKVVNIFIFGD